MKITKVDDYVDEVQKIYPELSKEESSILLDCVSSENSQNIEENTFNSVLNSSLKDDWQSIKNFFL